MGLVGGALVEVDPPAGHHATAVPVDAQGALCNIEDESMEVKVYIDTTGTMGTGSEMLARSVEVDVNLGREAHSLLIFDFR